MKNGLVAIAAATTLAFVTVAAPTDAEAHRWRGGGVAAGVIGGLAAGAIIGGALAGPRYYGGYYAPAPAYYGYGPAYYGPPCYWQRQRVWDGYGWVIRRVQVCY